MTQSISCSIVLGSSHAGLSDLRAQLYDTAGATVGSAVSTGFVVIGNAANGNYGWTGDVADDFQGYINFYSLATPTIAAIVAVNQLNTGLGVGAITHTVTVRDSSSNPIDGAEVWITTDSAGAAVVASGSTNASGTVSFTLDAGSYYQWVQAAGHNFTNPTAVTVS